MMKFTKNKKYTKNKDTLGKRQKNAFKPFNVYIDKIILSLTCCNKSDESPECPLIEQKTSKNKRSNKSIITLNIQQW